MINETDISPDRYRFLTRLETEKLSNTLESNDAIRLNLPVDVDQDSILLLDTNR